MLYRFNDEGNKAHVERREERSTMVQKKKKERTKPKFLNGVEMR